VMKRYSIRLRNLIVVQDDIDLETGKLKIKRKGSSGGHKGVESVIEAIGADEFIRVKVGIGREVGVSAEVYVLRKFRKGEIPVIREAITRAADAVAIIVKEGADSAMNRFH